MFFVVRRTNISLFAFSFIIFVALFCLTPKSLFAAEKIDNSTEISGEEEKREIENEIQDPMYGSSYGDYKGDNIYYMLDLANPKEIEEIGFFSKAWEFMSLQVVDDKISEAIHYSIFFMVEINFKLNIFMTNIMLSILNFAYDTNLINSLIDNTGETVRSLTGISGTSFGSNGLFGGFLGLVGLLVAIYTLYQFTVKKASILAFSGILKSLLALTLALLFFSNYSAVLKGAHTVSTDLSAALLSGNVGINIDKESGVIEDTTVREKMNDNIFTMFVHRPYLMLQYGTTIEEDVGASRVEKLLTTPKGEERKNIVIEEVTEKGNDSLTYSNVVNRLVFAYVMSITNAVSSIPIYLLALSLILFQFWFLVMALIAPFVFLWSAMPEQFGVLKRYFFELSIPLVLKMGMSVIALIIFGITDVLYNINHLGGGTQGFIITTLIQSLILFTLFLLRKRIFNVFSLGSRELGLMREQMNATFIEPAQKGLRTTLTTTGAVVGTLAGGPKGAMMGANLGSSLGDAATGQSGFGETTKDMSMSMVMMDRMGRKEGKEAARQKHEANLSDKSKGEINETEKHNRPKMDRQSSTGKARSNDEAQASDTKGPSSRPTLERKGRLQSGPDDRPPALHEAQADIGSRPEVGVTTLEPAGSINRRNKSTKILEQTGAGQHDSMDTADRPIASERLHVREPSNRSNEAPTPVAVEHSYLHENKEIEGSLPILDRQLEQKQSENAKGPSLVNEKQAGDRDES